MKESLAVERVPLVPIRTEDELDAATHLKSFLRLKLVFRTK
jgi:hypothetical protein